MNILMLIAVDFNKIPTNGDLWIPGKVKNVCMVSGLVAAKFIKRVTNVCHSLEVCNETIWTNFLMG